jgi:hypothetical protein
VRWTAEQYVRRVLVEVAASTGRPMADVANESFALTLWTWGELREIAREREVERLGERVDVAGMVAMAFHEPWRLQGEEHRYYRAAGVLGEMLDGAKERAIAAAARAARARPKTGA